MNALLTAIFDRKPDRVREIARQHPELLSVPTASGILPLSLALGSGYIYVATALLQLEAPGTESVSNWRELLEHYIRQLSHNYSCAGWLSDIEFIL
ncbi:MAG: hypothetical protein JWR26_3950 [Pedosphaera sp.]|nr:hypothetical protein [Pedosphaera sp.]